MKLRADLLIRSVKDKHLEVEIKNGHKKLTPVLDISQLQSN